jgi:hypothetical protein
MPLCFHADDAFRAAKRMAEEEGKTLREVIETALRLHLSGPSPQSNYKLQWRNEKGGLKPGARLDVRDGLLDLMEGRR